jgi:hypothetical protein
MVPGQHVCSIPKCKYNCHEGTCLQLFQTIGSFECIFIEAHHVSKTICKQMSLKSGIKSCSLLEEIMSSSTKVLKDFESDIAVNVRNLGNATGETAESNDTVKQTAGS